MMENANQKITTFLMFEGKAEEAMNFYVSLFKQAEILTLSRHEDDGSEASGKVAQAVFSLNGQRFMCMDSPIKHEFTFTPAISLFVTCETESEIDELFVKLSQGGGVLMPLDSYPFSKKFAWVADRYGVSWQLSWGG
ncbi:putative 3-demethylubiquinone-9 3-methyltransferase (glyoxalase superfamily) [Laceyella sediminis]|uniref:Glyoxalase superfamily enzyme, possibly 3-demethylubiquinone-9 3-methyltransferase n=3 Tax=Thermoactinomycetaceae TaxID=186824 RepID=A0AA45WPB5_9BACL|nr:putative 3-demethylubiquinone-9 3-methyltransferase (glyoxalase superfamily) [Laceyella sediminis]SMP19781.1 Glyoxalase superfamily enzyme, possibly 3-demethylubiquinone-9 3-methyltransferase [Laceyella tengchongensis]